MDINQIKILLIEENSLETDNIKSNLEIGTGDTNTFTLKETPNISEGLNYLRQEEFDIILISTSLPDSDGLDSFVKVWHQASYIPVIALSEQDDEDLKIKLLQNGAQDYLIKGKQDKNHLVNSILFAIERNKILEPLKRDNIGLAAMFKNKEYTERKLKSALANVKDIVIETDNDNYCTFINTSGINIFGTEIIGNKMMLFKDDTQQLNDKLQSLSKNEALCFENWNQDKKGEKRQFSWTCNLITSITGEKEGFLLTAHDLTNSGKSDSPKPEKKHKLLGQLLLEKGYISGRQLESALAEQHKTKILLGEILIRMGYITPEELADVLIMQAEIDHENE